MTLAQSAAGKKAIKGPRALGLVELAANGKAHLVPITILYDGEFYDASAYKAAPVPMALESGTVYEGFRTGVSLGLFTVTGALQGNNTWLGAGTWQSDSAIAAAKDAAAKKRAVMSKPAPEPPEGPPVLRRASPKPKSDDAASGAPAASGPAPTAPAASAPTATSAPPAAAPEADSDRPVLKRPAPATDTTASALCICRSGGRRRFGSSRLETAGPRRHGGRRQFFAASFRTCRRSGSSCAEAGRADPG